MTVVRGMTIEAIQTALIVGPLCWLTYFVAYWRGRTAGVEAERARWEDVLKPPMESTKFFIPRAFKPNVPILVQELKRRRKAQIENMNSFSTGPSIPRPKVEPTPQHKEKP